MNTLVTDDIKKAWLDCRDNEEYLAIDLAGLQLQKEMGAQRPTPQLTATFQDKLSLLKKQMTDFLKENYPLLIYKDVDKKILYSNDEMKSLMRQLHDLP